jgi:hypothetical protein
MTWTTRVSDKKSLTIDAGSTNKQPQLQTQDGSTPEPQETMTNILNNEKRK